jgi:hypothetical protein
MISFKQFINGDITRDVSPEEFVKWCETNASAYLNGAKDKHIYRGMPGETKVGISDTNGLNRKSANSLNYYTIWIDNNPAWKEYPKRSKSFICSTNLTTASSYGNDNTFLIIPADNAKIGICPEYDLWMSFKYLFKKMGMGNYSTLDNFNSWIHLVMKLDSEETEEFKNAQMDYKALVKCLKKVTLKNLTKNLTRKKDFEHFLLAFERSGCDNLFDLMQLGFNPLQNGFDVETGATYKNPGPSKEVWIQGTCGILKYSEDGLEESDNEVLEDFMTKYMLDR